MHERGGCADVSPKTSSLLALIPRQVLLVELQRNSAMAKKRPENSAELKSEDESILICSIAQWLENKGLSKVLKRFISATHIQDDDWKAKALNLNEIFSNHLDSCNDAHKDNTIKKLEEMGAAPAEQIGSTYCAVPEGIVSEKKKKKMGDVPAIDSERTSEDAASKENTNESNLKLQWEKHCKTNDALSHGEQKLKTFNESTMERVCELTPELGDEAVKKQKDKKKKNKSELTIVDEKLLNALPEVTEGKQKDLVSLPGNGRHDSEVTEDKKKKKKMKRDDLAADNMSCELGNNKVFSDKNASSLESKHQKAQAKETNGKKEASIFVELTGPGAVDSTSKKKSVEAAGDVVNESKKSSKKRKRLASDENEKLPSLDVVVEESKRRKTNGIEPKNTLPRANGHVDSQNKEENFQVGHVRSQNLSAKQTGEIPNDDFNNGVEKLSHPKYATKQHNNSAEPKTVNAFQRVKIDDVEFVDERLQDNSYWAKDGAENGYGAKAQEVLGQVKGRGFRHEKTKKKRGSYRGGQIDLDSHSIKFNYSDDD